MTRSGFAALLQSLAAAWTARDYAKAIGFFADDIRYADPLRYRFKGTAELRRFFEDDGGYPQRTVWHNVVFDEQKQLGAAEYSYRGTHLYHGIVLIKLHDDRITHWREYQHISDGEWAEFAAGTAFESA